ncbi:GNAT family N-acetyltransferase [Cohnella thailandensis]|uniref:GNAT family N-acetyltransferase n=1 Tax=Cohnella thailandensis TaxID=557557 RepID=A0A841T0R5_9BACL|nr:GNAT family N-acetyltransferase [Cohnella thailandensis]MBB6635988.1 GNAT family N-acetyltransferase [Cohnella thailandensis]MBP1976366.1 GNAT superfamily N-acetyltransferase [Cohnella thailandensis]
MNGIVSRVDQGRLEEAAALADRVFREGETFMGAAFPSIFSGSFPCSHGVYEEDRLAAFVGLVPAVLRIGPARVPLFSIGAVCTAPESRGRGYASALLRETFRHIEDAGGSLLFVSGTLPIYRRNGCHPFGSVRQYRLSPEEASVQPEDPAFEWSEFRATDLHRLQELSEGHEVRYDRSLYETAELLRTAALAGVCRMKQKVLLGRRGGQATAFLVLALPGEIPAETRPFVVEWGGDAKDAAKLMSAAAVHFELKEGLDAFVPWQERKLMQALEGLTYKEVQHSGTVKVGNPSRLWEQLRPYLDSLHPGAARQVAISDVREEPGTADVSIDGETRRLAAEQLISFLFDPASGPRESFRRADLLNALLPIPLPSPSGLNFV